MPTYSLLLSIVIVTLTGSNCSLQRSERQVQGAMEDSCISFLTAVRAGNFSGWSNVISRCTRSAAENSLGATGIAPDASGFIGAENLGFRTYPASAFAPYGIIVWYAGDSIAYIQLNSPVIKQSKITPALGEPELLLPSGLSSFHRQHVYASSGLVFHVSEVTEETLRIYVFRPCTKEDFPQLAISKVEQHRIKRQ
jgi:hypothetical protein